MPQNSFVKDQLLSGQVRKGKRKKKEKRKGGVVPMEQDLRGLWVKD
jgi:hypothetical protein